MPTYLFAWNPVHWGWPELDQEVRRLKRRGHVDIEWASGRARAIDPRQPSLHGAARRSPEGDHWRRRDVDRADAGTITGSRQRPRRASPRSTLRLRLEVLGALPLVTFEDLAKPPYSRFRWGIRASGTRLPSTLADALEDLWEARVKAAAWSDTKKAPPRPRRVRAGRAD